MVESKIGIIVPYRDREEHLKQFIPKIKSTLKEQKIPYEIIVVEQSDNKPFNRGKLLNIGFKKAMELNCTYVAFHDVDMLPIKVDYSEVDKPTHIATRFEGDVTRTIADDYFGGVTLFPIEDFKKINGYSNEYWGWGFEDDDLLQRYRIHFPNHKVKTISTQINNTVAMNFNGCNSYIESPNPFDLRNFTILISCEPEEIRPDELNDVDEYSIFAVPGYDMGFSYDSFGRYKFQTWDYRKNLIQLNSDLLFAKKIVLVVTVNQREQIIKFFIDGKKVDEQHYEKKLRRYGSKSSIFIGKSGSSDNKRQHFKGNVDYFAIWNHSLEEEQVESIYKNLNLGLTAGFPGYETTHCLEMCYDMKIISNTSVIDLSGHERHGEFYNSHRVITEKNSAFKDIIVPWRKAGKFLLLEHEENGFVDNQWKHPDTRKNQIRFNEMMMKGTLDEQKDGLSTLRFRLREEDSKNSVYLLKVRL